MINSNWHPISYRFGFIAAYCSNFGHFAFFEPRLGGLKNNIRCSSWAYWKARSGLPISVNWTFFARCYGWGATSEYRLKIGDFAPTGPVDPKFQVEGVSLTNNSFSQKTRLNDLSYGIKNLHRFLVSFCQNSRVWQTDRHLSRDYRAPCINAARWKKQQTTVEEHKRSHAQASEALQLGAAER